jgi:hypothetical protein
MDIQRRYEPDPEAADRVVDILYRLLVEAPGGLAEGSESEPGETETSTCNAEESEG